MTIDQIVNYEVDIPTEVNIKNKDLNERLKLIEQLEEEDKNVVYRIIDNMLTKSKFKDFFNKMWRHYKIENPRKARVLFIL